MKAVICEQYGTPSVLKVRDIKKPVPDGNQVLVRVRAATATAADTMMRRGVPLYGRLFIGLFKPKVSIPGTGFSGTVESIGSSVDWFHPGDHVFGEITFASGTNAEYICVPQDQIIFKKPESVSHIEAASIGDGLVTSLNFLTKLTELKKGNAVLINGASGSLGTAAIQIAKELGAHVTALCSAKNSEFVKSLGADKVVDYTQGNHRELLNTYDVIYDTVGTLSFKLYKKNLTARGVFISPVLSLRLLCQVIASALFGKKKALFSATGLLEKAQRIELFDLAVQLLQNEKLYQVIDQTFSLEDIELAHRYIETGRKVGNLAIVI